MNRIFHLLTVLTCFMFLLVLPINGQHIDYDWRGRLKDGSIITEVDIVDNLSDIRKWPKSNGEIGKLVDLSEADLYRVNLRGLDLSGVDLRGADLSDATLNNTKLSKANLSKANLKGARLYEAKLSEAHLPGANLSEAILEEADLSNADLSNANLYRANLEKADLSNANLREADLSEAFLKNAKLPGTNLSVARMVGANLSGTVLSGANLEKADLSNANLSNADLYKADLRGVDLSEAKLFRSNMKGTDLKNANLERAWLRGADIDKATRLDAKWLIGWKLLNRRYSRQSLKHSELSNVGLHMVNLSGKDLSGADLSGADLTRADLSGTKLSEANLSKADLSKATLRGADLSVADLSNAKLYRANMSEVNFEPIPKSVPKIIDIDSAYNISELTFKKTPEALVTLREVFKKAGLQKQMREVNRAIHHIKTLHSWEENSLFSKIEASFKYVFFELTCQYGMMPGRPLIILLCLVPFFFFFYFFALKTKRPKTGIWLIFPKGYVRKATGTDRPFKLTAKIPLKAVPTGKLNKIRFRIFRWYRMIRIAFYFSLLSAFSIGWRELNVGNWITRLQRREYILRSTGWVRTVSGIQSLSSVYLLALWVLTYFGRPFEAV